MAEQNLILNILTFTHPVESIECAITDEKKDGWLRIYRSEWPVNIEELFPDLNSDTSELYLSFELAPNQKTLIVNPHKSQWFSKHYYNWLIFNYFKNTASVSRRNFVKDNEIWFWDKQASIGDFFIFKKFIIKVQINRIIQSPELVISYEGISKVFKEGINKIDVPTECLKKVVYNRQLILYKDLSDEEKRDISKIRPVLNNSMRSALGMKWEPNKISNKLKLFYEEVNSFIVTYLNKPEFKAIIPIDSENFISVPSNRIFNTTKGSNLLTFGNNQTDLNPYMGLVKYGPFAPTKLNKIEFILIFHDKDRHVAENFKKWLDGKVNQRVKSLKDFLRMNYFELTPFFNRSSEPSVQVVPLLKDECSRDRF